MKILIVDDVPQVVELIRQTLLQASGVVKSVDEIRTAHSVAEARLELLRFRPELLILDVILPGEASIDLLEDPLSKGLSVILVSAMSDDSTEEWGKRFPQVLGRLIKWGWNDLQEGGERIRALLPKKP